MKKGLVFIFSVVFIAALIAIHRRVSREIDSGFNVVEPAFDTAFDTASDAAKRLHRKLDIVDLHADSLLWPRDLLVRNNHGHVDVPRLIAGNVALQAFTVVTYAPFDNRPAGTPRSDDGVRWVALSQMWPVEAWWSLAARTMYQAGKLHSFAERSEGKLSVVRTRRDLESYLERREKNPEITAGFLGIEGLHALEGELENVDRFFAAGFRMMGPTHFFDNAVGGSSYGMEKGGLTDFGRAVIRRMSELRILVDLAHASPQTIDEVLAVHEGPVVFSHTGVQATCPGLRNIADRHVLAAAKTGGVVGVGFWPKAVCGRGVGAIVRAIRHVADLAGVEHVALGSDFDGTTTTPFDVAGLPVLTSALLKAGFSEADISHIMGGNALRVLREVLPP